MHARATPEQLDPRVLTAPILDREGEASLGKRMDEAERRIMRVLHATPEGEAILAELSRAPEPSTEGENDRPGRALAHRAGRVFVTRHRALGASAAEVRAAVLDLERAKREFVEANMRLVVSIVRRREFQDRGVPLADLVQEGTFGLMRAVDNFDWRRGYKFSTYATWWIRQFAQRAVSEQSHGIRVPLGVSELLHQAGRVRRELLSRDGKEPDRRELAEILGVTMERLEAALVAEHVQPSSVHRPIGELGDGELLDLLRDEDATTPDQDAEHRAMAHVARTALASLPARDQLIVSLRFGLDEDRDHTLAEIGDQLGLTRQRVQQLETRALDRLRKKLEQLAARELLRP